MKITNFVFILLLIFLAISCSPPGIDTDIDLTEEILNDLGVNTELGNREDPNGNALAASYNPTGSRIGVLFKQCEIYFAGMEKNGHDNGLLEDSTFSVLLQETSDDWASGYPKKSIAADVDGDGIDEVVTLVYYTNSSNQIAIRLVDYNDNLDPAEIRRFEHSGTLESELSGTAGGDADWEDAFFRQDLAQGDLDGDGKAELILAVAGKIYILDDYKEDFATLAAFTVTNLSTDTDTYVRVATADFDMDGKDELVYTNGEDNGSIIAEYTILDDIASDSSMTTVLSHGLISVTTGGETYKTRAAAVATGDFDGDGLPETVFSGMREDNDKMVTLILDTSMNSQSTPVFSFLSTVRGDFNETGYLFSTLETGDIDGDGDDEIVAWQDIFLLENGEMVYHSLWGNEAVADTEEKYPDADVMCVGDVTGDKKADVVFLTWDNEQIRIRTVGSDGELDTKNISVGTAPSRPTLCLPNVDDDSAVVQYLQHELLFTSPVVIALIASPPYWTGLNDDGEGGTGFGSIEGQSQEEGSSHGFSTGISVGAEFSAPFGIAGASLKTTVENSFSWGVASTHEITETWGYSIGVGEDKVVFTAIPFDVYYYKILSSPDTSQIGETISINVPRKPGKFHQDVNYFNDHNGSGYDVGNSLLVHSLGNPFSYSDEDDRDLLKSQSGNKGLFSTHNVQVGTSESGTSSITLEDLVSETENFEYELSVDVEAEITAGGITAGLNSGYNYGYSYSSTVTTGTYIEGEVPDIPPAVYESSKQFIWGLMAYPKQDQDQKFTIVTYWVDR